MYTLLTVTVIVCPSLAVAHDYVITITSGLYYAMLDSKEINLFIMFLALVYMHLRPCCNFDAFSNVWLTLCDLHLNNLHCVMFHLNYLYCIMFHLNNLHDYYPIYRIPLFSLERSGREGES